MEKNDWRLQGQERYMKNLTFVRKKYEGKDHDHCEFCWDKFGYHEGNLTEGYCSEDNKRWVCDKCFNDFKKDFNFNVKKISGTEKQ